MADLEVDLQAHRVLLREQEVHLTPTEFNLLARLVRSTGKVVTHRQLLSDVWGQEYIGTPLSTPLHGAITRQDRNPSR